MLLVKERFPRGREVPSASWVGTTRTPRSEIRLVGRIVGILAEEMFVGLPWVVVVMLVLQVGGEILRLLRTMRLMEHVVWTKRRRTLVVVSRHAADEAVPPAPDRPPSSRVVGRLMVRGVHQATHWGR